MSDGKSEVVIGRYDAKNNAPMVPDPTGLWVQHSDYAALESLLLDARAEVERLNKIAVLAKKAQWLHSACWDLADGSGCTIPKESMHRFDEVFSELGEALGTLVVDDDEEAELFHRPFARAIRAEALAGELRKCVPTNWCDSLLTGSDGIGKPPYDCRTIEHLLRGILKDMDAAIDAVGGRGSDR